MRMVVILLAISFASFGGSALANSDDICQNADPDRHPNRFLLCELRQRQLHMDARLKALEITVDHINTTQIGGLAASIQNTYSSLSAQVAQSGAQKSPIFLGTTGNCPETDAGSCPVAVVTLCQRLGYTSGIALIITTGIEKEDPVPATYSDVVCLD